MNAAKFPGGVCTLPGSPHFLAGGAANRASCSDLLAVPYGSAGQSCAFDFSQAGSQRS